MANPQESAAAAVRAGLGIKEKPPVNLAEINKKLTRARANLVFEYPFFGAMVLRMKMEV